MSSKKSLLTIKSLGLGALLLGLAQTPVMGFSITLDTFNEFESGSRQDAYLNDRSGDLPSDTDNNLSTSNVFGGKRTISVSNENAGEDLIELVIRNSKATFSAGGETVGGAQIIWDGISDSSFVDLTDNGSQKSIEIMIQSLDVGTDDNEINEQGFSDLILTFELEDADGDVGTISQTFTSNDAVNNTSQYFSYASVVQKTTVVDNVDFGEIDRIRFFTSDENVGTDFVFNFVQTSEIPFTFSPGLGLLISGGFVGFLGIRSKKAQKEDLTISE